MTEIDTTNIAKAGDVEITIVKDIAKRSWILIIPVTIVLGLTRGLDGAYAVLAAGLLVLINLYIAAEIARVCARISPNAIMAGALGGFVARLALIFIVAVGVKQLSFIDFTVWLLCIAIGHIALLAMETRYISLSLAHPGVKPQ
jgi:hypothetical protein